MKAVLYCRVDGPQTSFALDAIKGQQLYLMDYAKKNNIEIAGIYLDVGIMAQRIVLACKLYLYGVRQEGSIAWVLLSCVSPRYAGGVSYF